MRYFCVAVVVSALATALPAFADGSGPLTGQAPIAVPRKPGYFDYMTIDAKMRRLIVSHSANDTMAIIDIDAGTVLKQVDLGDGAGGAGVAVDERDGKYFIGTGDNKVVDINRKNMVLQANIAMPGPIDTLSFDPNNDTLYADEGGGTHVWAINGKTDKIVATIALPAAPEYLDFDPVSNRIYQNIKPEPSLLLAINPNTNTVEQRWPLAPATRVHGLAIDGASGRLFSVGLNGKLAVVDLKSGAIVTTVDVAERVDQIAFDPALKRVYCPSGTGVMSVVQETDAGASLLGTVAIPRGTHTLAVDPKTHAVWISYGGAENDFVEKLTPNQ